MTQVALHLFDLPYTYPKNCVPLWHEKVDRWSQLDAYAFGLCDIVFELSQKNPFLKMPQIIFLASPTASNETDWHFVQSQCVSPAKFVHTLPNVRGSAMCQVLNWSGPILCVQKDPQTVMTSLQEAMNFTMTHSLNSWVLSVICLDKLKRKSLTGKYHAFLFILEANKEPSLYFLANEVQDAQPPCETDRDFFNWLMEEKPNISDRKISRQILIGRRK